MSRGEFAKMPGFWGLFFRLIPPRVLVESGLLYTALLLLSYSLGGLLSAIDSWLLSSVAAGGLVLGWLFARSRLKGIPSWLWMGSLWLAYAVLLPGRLIRPLAAAVYEALNLVSQIGLWVLTNRQEELPSTTLLLESLQALGSASSALFLRIINWAGALMSSQGAFDPLAAELAWSTAVWIAAAWAGWFIRRQAQPLLALLPSGLLLAGILNYTNSPPYSLVLFLGTVLLLIVLVNLKNQEQDWDARRIDYPYEVRMDVGLPVAPLLVLIMIAAAAAPVIQLRNLVEAVRKPQTQPSERLVAAGEYLGLERHTAVPFTPGDWKPGGLPRSHLLGTGPELAELPVLEIKTGELPPGSPEQLAGATIPRYYWRSLTFERYTGLGWVNNQIEPVHYQAGELARFAEAALAGSWSPPAGYRLLQQDIRAHSAGIDVLYAAGSLVSADREITIAWRSPRDKAEGEPGGGDVFGATTEAKQYRVTSLVLDPDPEMLRISGSDYPDWIADRYLSLPPSVPRRVYTLAYDLTAAASTRYDRALAIEAYLRSLPYSLDIPLPPPDRDVVDYYLFDLKIGYCDYAASAMVVLARAAGMPARLVMGYATGNYNTYNARYEVSQADAHSWVEIYFPGTGWVEFEPTGGRPEIHTTTGAVSRTDARAGSGWSLPPHLERSLKRAAGAAAAILGIPVLLSLAWFAVDELRLRKMQPLEALSAVYRRMDRRGRAAARGEIPIRAGETPYEFTSSLNNRLSCLPAPEWAARIIAPAAGEIASLADLYARASYSPRPATQDDGLLAVRLWRRLRLRLWLASRVSWGRGSR